MNIIGITGRRDDGSSAHAGKDEVAKVLVREHGFVAVSFADPVKRVAQMLYGFSDKQLWGSLKEAPDTRYPREHGPWNTRSRCACCGLNREDVAYSSSPPQCYLTPRFALKVIGTEMGRTLYEDTWVRIAIDAAKKLLQHEKCYPQYAYSPSDGLFERNELSEEGRKTWPDLVRGIVIPDVRWPDGNEGRAILAAGGRLWRVDRPGVGVAGTAHASENQPAPDDSFAAILKNDGTLADLAAKVREEMVNDHVRRWGGS